jgi:hypothetical protein
VSAQRPGARVGEPRLVVSAGYPEVPNARWSRPMRPSRVRAARHSRSGFAPSRPECGRTPWPRALTPTSRRALRRLPPRQRGSKPRSRGASARGRDVKHIPMRVWHNTRLGILNAGSLDSATGRGLNCAPSG